MFQLTPQATIDIYLIKINEIEMSEDFTERDKNVVKQFYKKKITRLAKSKKK